jgi:hypothetical protein
MKNFLTILFSSILIGAFGVCTALYFFAARSSLEKSRAPQEVKTQTAQTAQKSPAEMKIDELIASDLEKTGDISTETRNKSVDLLNEEALKKMDTKK